MKNKKHQEEQKRDDETLLFSIGDRDPSDAKKINQMKAKQDELKNETTLCWQICTIGPKHVEIETGQVFPGKQHSYAHSKTKELAEIFLSKLEKLYPDKYFVINEIKGVSSLESIEEILQLEKAINEAIEMDRRMHPTCLV